MNKFVKGMMIGGILGAAASMARTGMQRPYMRKRILRTGRTFSRRAASFVNSIGDMLNM